MQVPAAVRAFRRHAVPLRATHPGAAPIRRKVLLERAQDRPDSPGLEDIVLGYGVDRDFGSGTNSPGPTR